MNGLSIEEAEQYLLDKEKSETSPETKKDRKRKEDELKRQKERSAKLQGQSEKQRLRSWR